MVDFSQLNDALDVIKPASSPFGHQQAYIFNGFHDWCARHDQDKARLISNNLAE
jgi:hypothetical protein